MGQVLMYVPASVEEDLSLIPRPRQGRYQQQGSRPPMMEPVRRPLSVFDTEEITRL